ncbi:unnamed protein product, partial [Vitis vinifera]
MISNFSKVEIYTNALSSEKGLYFTGSCIIICFLMFITVLIFPYIKKVK